MKQQFKPMNRDHEAKNYWEGRENKGIRLWVYLDKGLEVLTKFRYYMIALIAIYAMIKFIGIFWALIGTAIVGIIAIPVLIFVGKWYLQKAQKNEIWISTEYGNPLKYNMWNIQVEILETLRRIEKK